MSSFSRKYKNYTSLDMQNALISIKTKQMSVLKASKIYNIPNRTLYDRIKKSYFECTEKTTEKTSYIQPEIIKKISYFKPEPEIIKKISYLKPKPEIIEEISYFEPEIIIEELETK